MSLVHHARSSEHARQDSWLTRLDPRTLLLCAGVAALWVGLLPSSRVAWLGFLISGLAGVGMVAQIPPLTLGLRACVVLPFVLVPGALQWSVGQLDSLGLLAMAARGYSAAMVATLLVSLAPFARLLTGAAALGLPDLLLQVLAMTYRYLHSLRRRASAVSRGARARGFGPRSPRPLHTVGNLLGTLFVHSLDRSERVHAAMLARGYRGRFPVRQPLMLSWADAVVVSAVTTLALGSLWAAR